MKLKFKLVSIEGIFFGLLPYMHQHLVKKNLVNLCTKGVNLKTGY